MAPAEEDALPAAQLVQADAALPLNFPLSQVKHADDEVAAGEGEDLPSSQSAHEEAPAVLYVPAPQLVQAPALTAPEALPLFPASHSMHVEIDEAPTELECLPATHSAQVASEDAPSLADHLPLAQSVQLEEPARENLPCEQVKQSDMEFEPSSA